MTPDALRATLAAIRWGPTELAAAAGCSRSLANQWLSGKRAMPAPVSAWLSALAQAHAALAAPVAWTPQPGRRAA